MTASETLIVVLACTLAVFLILGIILTIYLIKIVAQIRRVTGSAERIVLNFESIVATAQKAAAPAVITRFVMDQIQKLTDRKTKRDQRDEKET